MDEEILKALEPFARVQGYIEQCRDLDRDAIFRCSFSIQGTGATNGGQITEKEIMAGYYAYLKLQHKINHDRTKKTLGII